MKYHIEDYVDWLYGISHDERIFRLETECQFLGDSFYQMYREIQRLDPDNHVLYLNQRIAKRIAEIGRKEAATEAQKKKRKREAELKRAQEQARTAARQAVLDKLTHEEKLAFGLVQPEKQNGTK
jgi:lipid II:glycine glycyltransferase (peptidoglycan interpeptide bridge formation enzyme)